MRDLSGMQFGEWRVEAFDCYRNNKARWLCKCACGQRASVYAHSLTGDSSHSCKSCAIKRTSATRDPAPGWRRPFIDLEGLSILKWTVLQWIAGSGRWLCICQCGEFGSVSTTTLMNGKSIGCKNCRSPRLFTDEERKERHAAVKKEQYQKNYVVLSDYYVRTILCSKSNLHARDIPNGLIEIKREQLKLLREIRK